MFGGIWRWLWGAGGLGPARSYGGKVARGRHSWGRGIRRHSPTWKREVARTRNSWNRVVRYDPVANAITRNTLQAHKSDDRLYLFDLTGCPEIASGDTIAAAEILGDTAGLSIGSPEATTVALDGIDAGEAVQVVISGWTADTTYNLSCRVTFASGRKVVVPGRWVVAADY